jgi:hypothetical protein
VRTRDAVPTSGAVVAVFVLLGVLAGCSGGDGAADSEAAGDSGGSTAVGEVAARAKPPGPDRGVGRALLQTRAVVKTGQVAVTNADLDRVRDEVDRLLFALDGTVDSEETSHDRDGNIERSTLVVRVPVAKFKATMDAFEKLGRMKTSESTSKDVTTEVIDVDERVETLQTSLDRLQDLQRDSANIDDLIRFEEQITERESELQSLKAQQAYLSDQTSMSTVTLHLSTPETYIPPPGALDDAGFLTGLRSGWSALQDFVVVALTVLGAVIPFAVALPLVAVPVWLLARALVLARRRTPSVDAADPPASG